ncbi:MAG: alpha/beta hydrolase, partial [Butyrivibrio sp.]|nr:alpha/beta hydrolase [Butyrivibrio sp.]
SNDEVLNMNAYEENKANWPEDSTEIVIDGGNHSYFGTYGIQDGDGTPSISNQEQIDITAQIIDDWIGK